MAAEAADRGDNRENGPWANFRQFLRMVKFEHTIFGLPFVFMGMVLAADGLPPAGRIFWIILAAVGARNFAMSLNRFADRDLGVARAQKVAVQRVGEQIVHRLAGRHQ